MLGSTNVAVLGGTVVNGVVVGGSHAGPAGSAYVGDKDASDFSPVVSSVSISENAGIRSGYVFGGACHMWGDGAKSSDIYGGIAYAGGGVSISADSARLLNSFSRASEGVAAA